MNNVWRFALAFGILLSISASASAQPLSNIPPWREGQYVYVVPQGWDAPLFGPNDFREMDGELSKLTFPFYVVIASELNGSEDGNVAVDAADAIAQRWAETGDGYDVGKSQIFVLSFEPRKYGSLMGKTFTTTVGINPDELNAHNRLFEDAMRGTPKDPKAGILALARSLDAFLVDRTDPVKIAQRAEAARLAAIARAEAEQVASAQRKTMFAYGSIGIGILALLFFLILRRNRYLDLKERFTAALKEKEEMVQNASLRYVGFNDNRDAVKALGSQQGRTKELFDKVSAEVDDIYASVCAVQTNVGRCKLEAATAGFWDFGPLISAQAKLTGTFTFDTGEMNEGTLFGSETKTITVDVAKFTDDLEARYKACINGWTRLKAATEQVGKTAKELFPHAKLDALMATADANGIPRRWLHDHPLYGDDAADEAMYADLDASNQADPVAFADGVSALNAKETEVTERLQRILALLKSVISLRQKSAPSTYDSVVDPGDDPVATFQAARREDAAFMTMLASSELVGDLEAQASRTRALYQEAVAQSLAIKTAVDTIEADLAAMRTERTATEQEQATTRQRYLGAQQVHSNLGAERSFTKGAASLKEGQTAMSSAAMANSSRRQLTASKLAKGATASFTTARRSFVEAVAICDAADAKRAEYLQAANGMGSQRDSAAAAIIGYGASANLSTFSAPRVSGPADYAALMASLVTVRESWALAERKAREAYEAEQRRRREAEERARRAREAEAQRQRDAAAAAARRRASAASASRRSSSGGGGFGGGGSSSRGGSFGGGRSSGRGGSW